MENLVGRFKEAKILKDAVNSRKSEFIAVYGRRRVGKTFLIREVFEHDFSFYLTGIANVNTQQQLAQFYARITVHFPSQHELAAPANWFDAFNLLIRLLEQQNNGQKKIIFLDELPWLDTHKSNFIPALEHFWNSWASARKDIVLIVCGSAASWMINNLLRNRGGLHNRVTERIKLEPFSLAEVKLFFEMKHINFDPYQIVVCYMVFGGIPYYLERISPGLSAMQNINKLCFERNAPFRMEYEDLYASLFKHAKKHQAVINALSTKNKGLTRKQIIKLTGLSNGGGLTRILTELEESSFIRSYRNFGKNKKEKLFQLVDLYSLFYLNFIKNSSPDDENFWINATESPTFRTWSGYAFEMVCLHHVTQIKKALGISIVQTSVYSWQSKAAQIDLIIDRKDQVINLCEMKFSFAPYIITKKYADALRQKSDQFRQATETNKAIFLTMITTYGVAKNKHDYLVQNDLTMEDLFTTSP